MKERRKIGAKIIDREKEREKKQAFTNSDSFFQVNIGLRTALREDYAYIEENVPVRLTH